MNLRVDRDDRGAYGKASAITIDGRLLAPEIVIHGSETGANTVRFGATADAGGALDGNGLLTQGNTMQILGGSGQGRYRDPRAPDRAAAADGVHAGR